MDVLSFINDQILKMQWLSDLIKLMLESMGLSVSTPIGGSVHFFIYDTIKIFFFLSLLIFLISYIQSYFPPERARKVMGRFKGIGGNIMGALLGTITPFCSCSSIPLFIGFTEAGLPVGVTFSFLISSPLVDLASMFILMTIFGWKIALAYVLVGLILAVAGGKIISALKMERYIQEYVFQVHAQALEAENLRQKDRFRFAGDQLGRIVKKVWWFVLIGVGVGAAIHNWIPREFIENTIGQNQWYSVPLATFIGVPVYADIFGTIPIAEALLGKGAGLGTVLSFMMAVTALSVPSLLLLKRVVKMKLLLVFTGIVTAGIIIIGYVFNALQFLLV
jgi:uncharacterized protein